MLAFHSHCQLGNKMFIYSCAHSLASKKQQSYCLSEIGELKYFVLTKDDWRWNSFKWLIFRIKNIFKKFSFFHFQDNRKDYTKELLDAPDNSWFYGYFQGEKYLYNNETEVRRRFQIKESFVREFEKIKNHIVGGQRYTIVHIRLKDYKTFGPDYLDGPDLSLPFSYYHDLIKKNEESNHKLIFLSDDILTVKKEFAYVKNSYFSDNSAIIDLQFIINADRCILSCSTFSWWGAWLNTKANKEIFIPDYFLGFKVKKEYPINIIPKDWVRITI